MPSEGTDIAKLAFSVDTNGAQETIKNFINHDLTSVAKAADTGALRLAHDLEPNGRLGRKIVAALQNSTDAINEIAAGKGLSKFFGKNNELEGRIGELTRQVNDYASAFGSLKTLVSRNVDEVLNQFGRLSAGAEMNIASLADSLAKAFSSKAINKDSLGELLSSQFKSALDTSQKIGQAQEDVNRKFRELLTARTNGAAYDAFKEMAKNLEYLKSVVNSMPQNTGFERLEHLVAQKDVDSLYEYAYAMQNYLAATGEAKREYTASGFYAMLDKQGAVTKNAADTLGQLADSAAKLRDAFSTPYSEGQAGGSGISHFIRLVSNAVGDKKLPDLSTFATGVSNFADGVNKVEVSTLTATQKFLSGKPDGQDWATGLGDRAKDVESMAAALGKLATKAGNEKAMQNLESLVSKANKTAINVKVDNTSALEDIDEIPRKIAAINGDKESHTINVEVEVDKITFAENTPSEDDINTTREKIKNAIGPVEVSVKTLFGTNGEQSEAEAKGIKIRYLTPTPDDITKTIGRLTEQLDAISTRITTNRMMQLSFITPLPNNISGTIEDLRDLLEEIKKDVKEDSKIVVAPHAPSDATEFTNEINGFLKNIAIDPNSFSAGIDTALQTAIGAITATSAKVPPIPLTFTTSKAAVERALTGKEGDEEAVNVKEYIRNYPLPPMKLRFTYTKGDLEAKTNEVNKLIDDTIKLKPLTLNFTSTTENDTIASYAGSMYKLATASRELNTANLDRVKFKAPAEGAGENILSYGLGMEAYSRAMAKFNANGIQNITFPHPGTRETNNLRTFAEKLEEIKNNFLAISSTLDGISKSIDKLGKFGIHDAEQMRLGQSSALTGKGLKDASRLMKEEDHIFADLYEKALPKRAEIQKEAIDAIAKDAQTQTKEYGKLAYTIDLVNREIEVSRIRGKRDADESLAKAQKERTTGKLALRTEEKRLRTKERYETESNAYLNNYFQNRAKINKAMETSAPFNAEAWLGKGGSLYGRNAIGLNTTYLKELQLQAKLTGNAFADMLGTMGIAVTGKSVISFFQSAIHSATSFGVELRRIQSLALDFSFEKLDAGLRSIDARFGNVTHNAKALYWAFSSGVRGSEEQLVSFTEKMSKLAKVINSDVMPTMDAATSIMNAYGMGAEDAGKISDTLFSIVKYGKASGSQLAQSIGHVVAPAAALGVELDDLGATVATLTKSMKTQNALTYLNNILMKMQNPTGEVKEVLDKLGLEINSTAIKAKGFARVIREIRDATRGDINLITKLFPDIRGQRAAITLLSTQFDDFEKQVQNFGKSEGNTDEAAKRLLDNPEAAFQALSNSIEMIRTEAGRAAINFLTMGGAVGGVIDKFNSMTSGKRTFLGYTVMIGGMLVGLSSLDKAIATLNYTLANFKVKKFGDEIKQMGLEAEAALSWNEQKQLQKEQQVADAQERLEKEITADETLKNYKEQDAALKLREEYVKQLRVELKLTTTKAQDMAKMLVLQEKINTAQQKYDAASVTKDYADAQNGKVLDDKARAAIVQTQRAVLQDYNSVTNAMAKELGLVTKLGDDFKASLGRFIEGLGGSFEDYMKNGGENFDPTRLQALASELNFDYANTQQMTILRRVALAAIQRQSIDSLDAVLQGRKSEINGTPQRLMTEVLKRNRDMQQSAEQLMNAIFGKEFTEQEIKNMRDVLTEEAAVLEERNQLEQNALEARTRLNVEAKQDEINRQKASAANDRATNKMLAAQYANMLKNAEAEGIDAISRDPTGTSLNVIKKRYHDMFAELTKKIGPVKPNENPVLKLFNDTIAQTDNVANQRLGADFVEKRLEELRNNLNSLHLNNNQSNTSVSLIDTLMPNFDAQLKEKMRDAQAMRNTITSIRNVMLANEAGANAAIQTIRYKAQSDIQAEYQNARTSISDITSDIGKEESAIESYTSKLAKYRQVLRKWFNRVFDRDASVEELRNNNEQIKNTSRQISELTSRIQAYRSFYDKTIYDKDARYNVKQLSQLRKPLYSDLAHSEDYSEALRKQIKDEIIPLNNQAFAEASAQLEENYTKKIEQSQQRILELRQRINQTYEETADRIIAINDKSDTEKQRILDDLNNERNADTALLQREEEKLRSIQMRMQQLRNAMDIISNRKYGYNEHNMWNGTGQVEIVLEQLATLEANQKHLLTDGTNISLEKTLDILKTRKDLEVQLEQHLSRELELEKQRFVLANAQIAIEKKKFDIQQKAFAITATLRKQNYNGAQSAFGGIISAANASGKSAQRMLGLGTLVNKASYLPGASGMMLNAFVRPLTMFSSEIGKGLSLLTMGITKVLQGTSTEFAKQLAKGIAISKMATPTAISGLSANKLVGTLLTTNVGGKASIAHAAKELQMAPKQVAEAMNIMAVAGFGVVGVLTGITFLLANLGDDGGPLGKFAEKLININDLLKQEERLNQVATLNNDIRRQRKDVKDRLSMLKNEADASLTVATAFNDSSRAGKEAAERVQTINSAFNQMGSTNIAEATKRQTADRTAAINKLNKNYFGEYVGFWEGVASLVTLDLKHASRGIFGNLWDSVYGFSKNVEKAAMAYADALSNAYKIPEEAIRTLARESLRSSLMSIDEQIYAQDNTNAQKTMMLKKKALRASKDFNELGEDKGIYEKIAQYAYEEQDAREKLQAQQRRQFAYLENRRNSPDDAQFKRMKEEENRLQKEFDKAAETNRTFNQQVTERYRLLQQSLKEQQNWEKELIKQQHEALRSQLNFNAQFFNVPAFIKPLVNGTSAFNADISALSDAFKQSWNSYNEIDKEYQELARKRAALALKNAKTDQEKEMAATEYAKSFYATAPEQEKTKRFQAAVKDAQTFQQHMLQYRNAFAATIESSAEFIASLNDQKFDRIMSGKTTAPDGMSATQYARKMVRESNLRIVELRRILETESKKIGIGDANTQQQTMNNLAETQKKLNKEYSRNDHYSEALIQDQREAIKGVIDMAAALNKLKTAAQEAVDATSAQAISLMFRTWEKAYQMPDMRMQNMSPQDETDRLRYADAAIMQQAAQAGAKAVEEAIKTAIKDNPQLAGMFSENNRAWAQSTSKFDSATDAFVNAVKSWNTNSGVTIQSVNPYAK